MDLSELFNVKGKRVAVTGGASGIGRAFAEALAEQGARVALLDMRADRLDEEVRRMRAQDFDVRGHVADVTDRAGLARAFDAVATVLGGLDVLFANAGIDPGPGFVSFGHVDRLSEGAFEAYDDARWDRCIDVNLNGVFNTIKAAVPHLKRSGGGQIVVTTSVASFQVEPALGMAYMAAKAGAAHLVRNAALELARYRIRVNAIAPGVFVTQIGGGWLQDPEMQKAIGRAIPLGRPAHTDEMKGLALYLTSEASSYMTGAQIVIDGGITLGRAD